MITYILRNKTLHVELHKHVNVYDCVTDGSSSNSCEGLEEYGKGFVIE